jgi:hypothetical protein
MCSQKARVDSVLPREWRERRERMGGGGDLREAWAKAVEVCSSEVQNLASVPSLRPRPEAIGSHLGSAWLQPDHGVPGTE